MTSTDEPFRLPDLTDVLEMERIVKQLGESKTAEELEEEIIRYVDQIRDEAVQLIRDERLAVGDSIALRPAVKWLQTGLLSLFAAGEMLPPDQRLPYLARLRLVIMAAHNIGGFTRLTRTAEMSAAVRAGQRAGKKKLQKAQPLIEARRAAVHEINAGLPYNLGWKGREAKINAGLRARGIKGVDRRTLQRDLKSRS